MNVTAKTSPGGSRGPIGWRRLLLFAISFLAFLPILGLREFAVLNYAGLILPLPLMLAFHHRGRLPSWAHPVLSALIAAICLVSAVFVCRNIIYWQIVNPREWDFLAFWYFGHAGVSGMDFYRLETFRQLPPFWNPPPGSEFHQTILEVGYLYAPPSMFWMLPLGWLSIPHAVLYWYGLQIAALAGCLILLKRIFLPGEGLRGWLEAIALVSLFPPVFQTLDWGQTNFTALLATLLFWRSRSTAAGGAWLAVGMTVKNYIPAFLMFSLLRFRLRPLAGFLAATAALAALAALYFGPEICLSYFTERPPTRSPLDDLMEPVNQSLSAFYLRQGFASVGGHPVFTWPYLVSASIMTLATAWAVRKAPEADTDWALSLVMTLILIFYPASWEHYAAMSLPAVFLIWTRRSRHSRRAWPAIAVLTAVFALTCFRQTLPAHLLLWSALLGFSPGLPWSARVAPYASRRGSALAPGNAPIQ